MTMPPRLRAILAQRCPICLEGTMYLSWLIGVTYLAVLAIFAQIFLVSRIGITWAVVGVVVIHMLCIPLVFRYSRVLWAHLNVRTRP